MKVTRTDKSILIEIDPGETFSQVEQRERNYGGKSTQIWIRIEKYKA